MTTNPPAVTASTEPLYLVVDPRRVVASPTNPRKRFAEGGLLDLAESMKESGQIHACLVRPLPASRLEETFRSREEDAPLPDFELVVGERRWRAATAIHMELRIEVRALTDLQVLRIQIVENLQREDVHPLDEAVGYDHLLRNSEGMTPRELAQEIGKSPSYVFQRLKLLELTTEAREAYAGDVIDLSTAIKVARLATPLQAKAVQAVKEMRTEGRDPGHREIVRMLEQRFHTKLSAAVFNIRDDTLVLAAGSCLECPKRTGNQQELFQDVDDADICTDPDCFGLKRAAWKERTIEKAREAGVPVLEGEAAAQVKTRYGYLIGHTNVNDEAYETEDGASVTYAELLAREKAPMPQHAMVVDSHHPESQPDLVITNQKAEELRKRYEPIDPEAPNKSQGRQVDPAERRRLEEEQRQEEIDRQYRRALLDAVKGTAAKPRTLDDLRLIVFALIGEDIDESVFEAAGIPVDERQDNYMEACDQLQAKVLAMGSDQLAALAIHAAVTNYWAVPTPVLEQAAGSHRINVKALITKVRARVLKEENDDHEGERELDEDEEEKTLAAAATSAQEAAAEEGEKSPLPPAARKKSRGKAQNEKPAAAGAGQGINPGGAVAPQSDRAAPATGAAGDIALSSGQRPGDANASQDGGAAPATGAAAGPAGTTEDRARPTLKPGAAEKQPVKYRCPTTGATWSGRGKKPIWLQIALADGKRLEDFATGEAVK